MKGQRKRRRAAPSCLCPSSTSHSHYPFLPSPQLRIEGLPTLVFVGTDPDKPALRTEGLLPSNVR